MRTAIVAALMLTIVPVTAVQAMSVAEFLAKAERLQKKGAMAMFSSDLKLLMNEGKNAGAQLRAERLADVKAGRRPNSCPPQKGSMGSDEVLTHFRSIPPGQRGMSVKAGLAGLMRKKFPCPAGA